MKYGKWGIFGGGIVVGLILANLFGGSSATPDKSNATAICSQQAARGLVQQIVENEGVMKVFVSAFNIDWSTVGGRPDPRDSNIFICVVSGSATFKPQPIRTENITVAYTVTLMGKQIQVRAQSNIADKY